MLFSRVVVQISSIFDEIKKSFNKKIYEKKQKYGAGGDDKLKNIFAWPYVLYWYTNRYLLKEYLC